MVLRKHAAGWHVPEKCRVLSEELSGDLTHQFSYVMNDQKAKERGMDWQLPAWKAGCHKITARLL